VQAKKFFLCRNGVQAIAFLRKGSYAPAIYLLPSITNPKLNRNAIFFFFRDRLLIGGMFSSQLKIFLCFYQKQKSYYFFLQQDNLEVFF
jgi:hypothetical protein